MSVASATGFPVAPSRPLLRGLTGVRALAAGWVVLDHFRQPITTLLPITRPLESFFAAGYLGVEVFFVLSGFIIAYTYAERFRRFSGRRYREFLELRFARIYPVHLAALLATGVLVLGAAVLHLRLASPAYTPLNFAANLVVLQAVPPFQPFNLPAWSICCEAAAYLAFPLLAVVALRIRSAHAGFAAAAVVVVLGTGAMLLIGAEVDPSQLGYPLIWARIAVEFTTGVLLWAGWQRLGTARAGLRWDVVVLVGAAVVVGTLAVVDTQSFVALAVTPAIAAFVLGCAGATGPVGRLLGSRVLVWGGKVSYSFYMTHFLVLTVVGKVLAWDRFADAPLVVRIAVLLGYALVVAAAGCAAYYGVEEPGRRLVRRLTARAVGARDLPPAEVVGRSTEQAG